ncbi:MAG TPA: hypothetical protein VF832_18615, partial [Longimicrobiales bacterium]
MSPDNPFPPEALEANRGGTLTAEQRQNYSTVKRRSGHDLWVAAFCVLLAIVLLRASGPAPSAWLRPMAALAALAAAVLLVLQPKGPARRRVERDLRAGRVESVEGAIAKAIISGTGRSTARWYYLDVGGLRLKVSARGYAAAPDVGWVRAYYLPSSLHVVNLERLPDRLPPREALASPTAAMQLLGQTLGLHGREEAAEARAEAMALLGALAPEQAADATPPGPADPHALSQAIVGAWHSGALRVSFAGDGAVTVQALGMPQRRGRWSVDAAGRLRS